MDCDMESRTLVPGLAVGRIVVFHTDGDSATIYTVNG